MLAGAINWQQLIDEGVVVSGADIAKRGPDHLIHKIPNSLPNSVLHGDAKYCKMQRARPLIGNNNNYIHNILKATNQAIGSSSLC